MKRNKDSIIGKGYSYLLAITLTIVFCGLHIDYNIKCNKSDCEFEVQTKEVSLPITLFFFASISTLIGMPTDNIASTIGRILTGNKKE